MLNEMVGQEFDFYGVCSNEFKLDDTVFEALEDESDGYRSYLASIERTVSQGIFFKMPLARVKVVESSSRRGTFEGWSLVDVEDGHEWLCVGTDYCDDYYPCFTFDYQPKITQTVKG